MNWILYVAVFAFFAAIGVYIWLGYRKRKVFYDDLISFCNHLLIEINFSKNTVLRIIDTYGANYSREFRTTVLKYGGMLANKKDITPQAVDGAVWRGLRTSSRAAVVEFFSELGRHGAREETDKIQNKKMIFDKYSEQATAELRRDASIYLKIFILIGVAAAVLLI